MATTKPRFSITVSDEIYEEINTYQHEHRLSTQTKAITALIEKGIEALQRGEDLPVSAPAPASDLTNEEWALVLAYRSADPKSRAMVDLALADYKDALSKTKTG